MNYLVIGYRPDGDDYCMGCHMESYSGDYLHEFMDEEEMIQAVAEMEAALLRGHGDSPWEYKVYMGARDAFDVTEDAPAAEQELEEERSKILADRINKKKDEIIKAREEAEKTAEEEKRRKEEAQKEERDRTEFDRLKKKYD